MTDKSVYYTTALAGYHVAGRRIPTERVDGTEKPRVGHPLELTADEAAYELSAGTIERWIPGAPASLAPAAPSITFAPPSPVLEGPLKDGEG